MVLHDLRNFKSSKSRPGLKRWFGEVYSLWCSLAAIASCWFLYNWVYYGQCGQSYLAFEVQKPRSCSSNPGALLAGLSCHHGVRMATLSFFKANPRGAQDLTSSSVHFFLLSVWSLCFLIGCLSSSWKWATVFPASHPSSSPFPSSLPSFGHLTCFPLNCPPPLSFLAPPIFFQEKDSIFIIFVFLSLPSLVY